MPIRAAQLKKKFIRFHHNSRPPSRVVFSACGMLAWGQCSFFFAITKQND